MDTKDQAAATGAQQPVGEQEIKEQAAAPTAAAPATEQPAQPIAETAAEPAAEKPPLTHDELVNQVIDTIVTEGMIDRDKVTPDATIESLDLKSIDIVMILTALEDKFDVYIPMDGPFHDAKNVKDLIDAIANYIMKEKQA